MNLSELLEKYQRKIDFKNSEEFKAISKYHMKLDMVRAYKEFIGFEDSFSLIVGYVVVNSLKNKEFIEKLTDKYFSESIEKKNFIDKKEVVAKIHEELVNNALPYFKSEDIEYYVPIFSRALNMIYSNEQYRLNEVPYNSLLKDFAESTIDLFEVYNFSLFDSNFTRLVKIKQSGNVTAFYHSDFYTIYFINDQGRLDYKICLFDKYLKKINTNHIIDRISKVVDAYFNKDKELMISELIKNDLVSNKIIQRYYLNNKTK